MIKYNFDEYVKRYIDKYLFNDLDTIHNDIKKRDGNLAYLYLFSVCSAMEFLGLLLRDKSPLSEVNGKYIVDSSNALCHYIKHYLRPISEQFDYELLQKIAPTLIRNGLAHSFSPKGPIAVGRLNYVPRAWHMTQDKLDGLILVHTDQLYEDFKKSYIQSVKPKIIPGGQLYENANSNYESIRKIYTKEVRELLSN